MAGGTMMRGLGVVALGGALAVGLMAPAGAQDAPAESEPVEDLGALIEEVLVASGASPETVAVYLETRGELVEARLTVAEELGVTDVRETLLAAYEDGVLQEFATARVELVEGQWAERREMFVTEAEARRSAWQDDLAERGALLEGAMDEAAALIEAGDREGLGELLRTTRDDLATARQADRDEREDARQEFRDELETERRESREERQGLRQEQRDQLWDRAPADSGDRSGEDS